MIYMSYTKSVFLLVLALFNSRYWIVMLNYLLKSLTTSAFRDDYGTFVKIGKKALWNLEDFWVWRNSGWNTKNPQAQEATCKTQSTSLWIAGTCNIAGWNWRSQTIVSLVGFLVHLDFRLEKEMHSVCSFSLKCFNKNEIKSLFYK